MYSNVEQIEIFTNCNSAEELLKCRVLLEESNNFSDLSLVFYNIRMDYLLTKI